MLLRTQGRRCGAITLLLILTTLSASPARTAGTLGQAPAGSLFTVEDMLDVATLRAVDLSKDGRWLAAMAATFVFACAEGNRPADLFLADAAFKNVRKLADSNPQLKAKHLAKTELIPYLDADGKKLFGVLYYPVDYTAGQKVPTVFLIYEQFFDDTFNGTISILNSNGYAVMQPSVNLENGFLGKSLRARNNADGRRHYWQNALYTTYPKILCRMERTFAAKTP